MAGAGVMSLSLVDVLVLLGIAVVLPLALGGDLRWWVAALTSTTVAFLLPTGVPAAVLTLPFLAVTLAALVARVGQAGPLLFWRVGDTIAAVAALWAVVAAGGLVVSRGGVVLLNQHEPIVELTTIHYTYAGAGALTLAGAALAGATGRWRRVAGWGTAITAVAPPVVATGFITARALPQVGGALLMTVGVWLTAAVQLHQAAMGGLAARPRFLLAVSGLSVWVPMVLAVAWAAARYWDMPALSIPAMARTHGMANAFGFIICGLVARRHQPAPAAPRQPVLVR